MQKLFTFDRLASLSLKHGASTSMIQTNTNIGCLKQQLNWVQLEAARIVTGTKFQHIHSSSNKLYLELGWLTLKNRRQFNKLSKLFSITKNQYPPYLKATLDTITNYHSHATRGHITRLVIYQVQNVKVNFLRNLFCHLQLNFGMNYMVLLETVNKLSFKKAVCSSNFKTSSRIFQSNIAHSTQVTFTEIRTRFSNLNHDLYHKGCTDTQSCDCGHIIEDSKPFFLICPLYNNPRRDMLNEVQMHSHARIMPQLLLNGNHCLNEGS